MALAKYFEEIVERYLEDYNSLASELWPTKEEREVSEDDWKRFKQAQFEKAEILLRQSKRILDELHETLTDPDNRFLDEIDKTELFRQRQLLQDELSLAREDCARKESLNRDLNAENNDLQRKVDRLKEENRNLKRKDKRRS